MPALFLSMRGNKGVSIHLPWIVPDVIGQEIVDGLKATLKQFRRIANDYFGTARTFRI